MRLSDEDVREILRIVDESELDELRIETEAFKLHVRRDGAPPAAAEPPAPAQPPAEPAKPAEPGERGEPGEEVAAPMLGIFYRAPSPSEPPFVEVGSRVEPDTVIGVIEVMKLMNSVPAGVAGTVAEIYAENAAMVEYGQPLLRVVPER